MPVFISYSRTDKDFVDRLATQLVIQKVHVWLDKWELHAGDSLITKIQDAITGASALLVVLSKASVKSDWCKKELSAGLMRELEEKRVIVVPILLEDCTVPTFLKEKLYADFRTSFDEGLDTVLEAIAKVTSVWQGRLPSLDYHTDWSIDWGNVRGVPVFRLTMVDHHKDAPYTIVGDIQIMGDPIASVWYLEQAMIGKDDIARRDIITAMANAVRDSADFNVMLEDSRPIGRIATFKLGDGEFVARAAVRWLGTNTGRPLLMRIAGQIDNIDRSMRANARTDTIDPPRADFSNIREGRSRTKTAPKKPSKKKADKRPTKKSAKKIRK